jgi:hypothetical protein
MRLETQTSLEPLLLLVLVLPLQLPFRRVEVVVGPFVVITVVLKLLNQLVGKKIGKKKTAAEKRCCCG